MFRTITRKLEFESIPLQGLAGVREALMTHAMGKTSLIPAGPPVVIDARLLTLDDLTKIHRNQSVMDQKTAETFADEALQEAQDFWQEPGKPIYRRWEKRFEYDRAAGPFVKTHIEIAHIDPAEDLYTFALFALGDPGAEARLAHYLNVERCLLSVKMLAELSSREGWVEIDCENLVERLNPVLQTPLPQAEKIVSFWGKCFNHPERTGPIPFYIPTIDHFMETRSVNLLLDLEGISLGAEAMIEGTLLTIRHDPSASDTPPLLTLALMAANKQPIHNPGKRKALLELSDRMMEALQSSPE
jgi:hypothetical protein